VAGIPSGTTLDDEVADLCRLHVDRDEVEERALERRVDAESWRIANLPPGSDPMLYAEVGRVHAEAHGRCLDRLVSALEGPGGAEALRILRDARLACESSPASRSRASVVECIHRRKLEIFFEPAERGPEAASRETLDRLLRVGDGRPLSDREIEQYCRSRELYGTAHPFCR
jgi:hypothetical protein